MWSWWGSNMLKGFRSAPISLPSPTSQSVSTSASSYENFFWRRSQHSWESQEQQPRSRSHLWYLDGTWKGKPDKDYILMTDIKSWLVQNIAGDVLWWDFKHVAKDRFGFVSSLGICCADILQTFTGPLFNQGTFLWAFLSRHLTIWYSSSI